MVRGLDRFRAHFAGYQDRYVLIGGTACSLVMEEVGLDFRATKDLDIVLCLEALDGEFVAAFWEFIKAGRYTNQQKSTGKKLFYRFERPEDETYPVMLELFSRVPDVLTLKDESHLTPIPVEKGASSLSAILLDDGYYDFIHAGKREMDGLSVLGSEYLIPLKARAWLELVQRKNLGENIDSKDIKKHRNDVFRLFQIVGPESRIEAPDVIKEDLKRFLTEVQQDRVDLRSLGLKNISLNQVLDQLRSIYGLGAE